MTTDKILERVYEALNCDMFDVREQILRDLAAALTDDLNAEKAHSAGRQGALRVVKAMLAEASKHNEGLGYAWYDSADRQCVCDGFQAYRMKAHLPLAEDPCELDRRHINLDNIIPPDTEGWLTVAMPSAAELRRCIAEQKASFTGKRKDFVAVYSLGDYQPSVNAQLLLNIAAIFPAVTELRWISIVGPIVFSCDDGDGVILPVRVSPKAKFPADLPASYQQAKERYTAWHDRVNAEAAKLNTELLEQRKRADARLAELAEEIRSLGLECAALSDDLKAASAAPAPNTATITELTKRLHSRRKKLGMAQLERMSLYRPESTGPLDITPEKLADVLRRVYSDEYPLPA